MTTGADTRAIAAQIQQQQVEDQALEQLTFKEMVCLFEK